MMMITWLLLLFLSHASGCSHSEVICNLWSLDTKETSNTIPWSTTGSFASHFSPPGSRCELVLKSDAFNSHKIDVHFAHIDCSSSVSFFTCNATDHCNLAFEWSGVAWNVQHYSSGNFKYTFTLKAQYLKIVLQVSASPSAPNTFALSWMSEQGCENAAVDDVAPSYFKHIAQNAGSLVHNPCIVPASLKCWEARVHRVY